MNSKPTKKDVSKIGFNTLFLNLQMSGSGSAEKGGGMFETLSKLSTPANHRPLLVFSIFFILDSLSLFSVNGKH